MVMTARCGSTLISQMMRRVPRTRSISEAWALAYLNIMYNRGEIGWKENEEMASNFGATIFFKK